MRVDVAHYLGRRALGNALRQVALWRCRARQNSPRGYACASGDIPIVACLGEDGDDDDDYYYR